MARRRHNTARFQTAVGAAFLSVCLHALLQPASAQTELSGSAQAPASPAFSVYSPYKTLSKTRQLLNTLATQVLLLLDYTDQESGAGTWKTKGLRGLETARYFVKYQAGGAYRTVEMAVLAYPEGGYEYYVYGLEIGSGAQRPNPDLPAIQDSLQNLAQTIQAQQQSPGIQKQGYQIYHLSYLQSDRALALLKVLGYKVVEYAQEEGEIVNDKIYSPYFPDDWELPVIVKLIDAPKTSLMDPAPGGEGEMSSDISDLGGTYLHQMTSGEPQQRLLIIYNKNDPEPMESLLNLLREKIDLPARQIVIEALVIEVNTDRMKELGLAIGGNKNRYGVSFNEPNSEGERQPFTFTFGQRTSEDTDEYDNPLNAFGNFFSFRSILKALVEEGHAEILSSPSVLVLNGRQARIQVGQQVPVSKAVSTTSGYSAGVEYIQTGIVLNIRPRISEDGSEITMQVETIVSAVNEALSIQKIGESGQVLLAPRVDNRQVQTFVRVADNTPFIVGGLISVEKKERTVGVPILSRIPILGLPFRRKATDNIKKEVIVVLTPHVVPLEEKSFSYVIPKDSDMFNAFGNKLFRNAYRIRDDDVFDLKFVYESQIFQNLLADIRERSEEDFTLRNREPFASLLDGGVPGEEILVRRMLWELIFDRNKTNFAQHIKVNRMILLEDRPSAPDSSGFQIAFLQNLLTLRDQNEKNTLALTFDARPRGTPDHPFVPPKSRIDYEDLDPSHDGYISRLMQGNLRQSDGTSKKWTILLSTIQPPNVRGATALQVLQGVMVLKRVLALNTTFPLTIKEFRVGRQIIFPTKQDLKQRFHIIDRDAARYFFEAIQYYPEFEKAFSRQTRSITQMLEASQR